MLDVTNSITNASRSSPERLAFVVEAMRELSQQTDPESMVQTYGSRVRTVIATDGMIGISRRELSPYQYRITRSSLWNQPINPWKERSRLPVYDRGLLGKLLYGDEPVLIDELHVDADDPAAEHFAGFRSLIAIPVYDGGTALNMTILMKKESGGFDRADLPERVWMLNLFGQAMQNRVLIEEVQKAYDALDRELEVVAEIQRSLLPTQLPTVPGLTLAASYHTSRRAGGDYYDFFPMPNGQWGMLIADVSGHGTPAAVLMAITHSIAHTAGDPKTPASSLLSFVNRRLADVYTNDTGNFVTAFYGVYDPHRRTLSYSNAGHPPPRLRRMGSSGTVTVGPVDAVPGLPLGIDPSAEYADRTISLESGDSLVLYTDGITEARNPANELLDTPRLDEVIRNCRCDAQELVNGILAAVDQFTGGAPPLDDRTLLAVCVE